MNKLNNKIKENFTIIPNEIIRNKNISDRARFIFCYMASMPDDWKFYQGAMAKELGYTKDTLRKYIDELLTTGYLHREQRREEGKFDSYDYTLNFIPSGKKADTVKSRNVEKPTREKSTLTNKDLEQKKTNTNKDFDKGCENDFSLPSSDAYIVNPFLRQSIHDALNTDTDPKESCAKEKVQRQPSETYLCFSAFASTYERLAGVTYPSDKGNYIMSAKDGANCKKLVTWLKKVSASEQAPEDMVTMFTTAAWQISDKWLKANFTISNIYSQANNIYTKFLYASPLAKEKKRQEEIDKLVNEFTL
jgi:predicted transcriptional regulator